MIVRGAETIRMADRTDGSAGAETGRVEEVT